MSDELEARMWDEGASRYESRSRGAFFESAFASSEHLDRAPLLSEVSINPVFFVLFILVHLMVYKRLPMGSSVIYYDDNIQK